jgi:hypothetical protein
MVAVCSSERQYNLLAQLAASLAYPFSKHGSNIGFEVFTAVVMKSIIFWDYDASIFRVEETGSANKQAGGRQLACWFAEPISSTQNMESICSSETSVETQRTTRRHPRR